MCLIQPILHLLSQVVVVADASLKDAMRINADCRQHGAAFVKAEIRGVFANVFTDFGNAFVVNDVDGVQPMVLYDYLILLTDVLVEICPSFFLRWHSDGYSIQGRSLSWELWQALRPALPRWFRAWRTSA